MIAKKRRGRRTLCCLAGLMACSFFINTAYAWQQEYIAEAVPGHTTERYTWDSDHQPSYNDILAERIQSTHNMVGPVLSLADDTPLDATSGISMGWNFPLSRRVTTGPIAALHYDGSTPSMYNEYGDSATTLALTDPLWHASVSTLGWRLNSQFGDIHSWAQISYSQQFGENIWKAQPGLSHMTAVNQEGNWLDVTIGADVLLSPHMAAYAAFSQVENSATDSDYLYTLGVSARF